MPQVRKITVVEATIKIPGKRGRPVGSKNKSKVSVTDFDIETLYTYTAKDGCSIQSAVKSKTMKMSCKHGKTMDLVK